MDRPAHAAGSLNGWRIVAVDVGGTSTRVRVEAGHERRRLLDEEHPGAAVTADGLDLSELFGVIRAVLDVTATHGGSVSIAIGATGLPELVDDRCSLLASVRSLGVDRVVLAADMVTAHVGALGLSPGVVVAAGTGVVALASDLSTTWHRVDGWGHLLGDEGGGSWVGMCGLRAALRSVDGRRHGSDTLARLAWEQFGDPSHLVRAVYTRADRSGVLASFAPAVMRAADAGDEVALRILRRAGHLLGEAAVAAIAATGLRTVTYTGGMFTAGEAVLGPMRRRVADASGAELVAPLGTPLDGAAELARLAVLEPHHVPRHPHFITPIGDEP